MGVQTDLRAGGGRLRCGCGSLIYVADNNVAFNIQLGLINFNSVHQD